ncbi:polyamine aminopropyltransferase [uncultured Dokdonia sp.]|uniref:polyamine aminopropyltransferase n=1 Tax=uncultured Dokdonia sp. TaxID=575653 RepID=UPI00260E4AB0|nr:polyamine aminopropyltransferase [uncultured Dokdonia sp.]
MNISNKKKSLVLKIALFATGFSGIVAEYVLSTLASYFIGNAILQFTLIVSIMLFSMGLGSRISKSFSSNIVFYFVIAELLLSLLVSFSAIASYIIYGYTNNSWIIIYLLSIAIGLLIGLEIPFATRINNSYEELRLNISNILEKDYYGSLLGGLFFAFIGLPYLGLTYTPFVLGLVNLVVSFWLFYVLKSHISQKLQRVLWISYLSVFLVVLGGLIFAKPLVLFGEQAKYKDKIVFSEQTKYQKIVITKWSDWFSLYINGNQQLSTFDEYLYHEPMVHTALGLTASKKNILILGGGDGCIARELLQYDAIESITLVDLDKKMIDLGKSNPIFTSINKNALSNPKVTTITADAYTFLEQANDTYDVILVDLPDPNNVDLNKLYTKEFYTICYNHLAEGGTFITQSGSPYYATKAFYCIDKTLKTAGFHTLPIHNQVLTLGEWGWILAKKTPIYKEDLKTIDLENLQLKWLNKETLSSIASFGKPLADTTGVKINTIFEPTLYLYYKQGNWDLY